MTAGAVSSREEWLKERGLYLGGTDIAGIVGKSKWSTPLTVYQNKVLGVDKASVPEAAEAGLILEPLVRAWFEKDTGLKVSLAPQHVRHPKYPFLGANADMLIDPDELGEIKTHSFRTAEEWGEEMTDEIPDAYHVQCVWYCGIYGRRRVRVVAVDTGTWNRRYYVVEEDPEYFDALVRHGVAFHRNHIEPKIPPEATGRADEIDAIRRIYPKDTGETILGGHKEDIEAESFLRLQNEIKALETQKDEVKAKLIDAIGIASYLETLYGRFSHKANKPKSTTNYKLVADGLLHELSQHDSQASSKYGLLVGLHTETRDGSRVFKFLGEKQDV